MTLETSSRCFSQLCADCADVLSPFTEQFVQQILTPEFIGTWSYSDTYKEIVHGFAFLVDNVSQKDMQRCTTLMPLVVRPLIMPLNSALMEIQDRNNPVNLEDGQMPTIDRSKIMEIQDMLDLLADFFQGLGDIPKRLASPEQTHPLASLFAELWPFIDRLMTEFVHEDGVVESICRLVKHGMRSL